MDPDWGAETDPDCRGHCLLPQNVASMMLVADDADRDHPTMEYTDGQITVFPPRPRQNTRLVVYTPESMTPLPPVTVQQWTLILTDNAGDVLARGVVSHAESGQNNIRRYTVTPA